MSDGSDDDSMVGSVCDVRAGFSFIFSHFLSINSILGVRLVFNPKWAVQFLGHSPLSWSVVTVSGEGC